MKKENNMEYSESSIQRLSGVLATQDPTSPNYLNGSKLVDFFNSFGFKDSYAYSEGRGIITPDLGEKLSRRKYVLARLLLLKKENKLDQALQRYIEMSKEPETAETDINDALKQPTKIFISHYKKEPDVLASSIAEKLKKQLELGGSDIEEGTQEDKLRQAKQKLTDEIFGVIPNDRIVVFISYSWESADHQIWVTALADKLTESGFYVLFDKYNESGTSLELFMELGLERADKIIVIGTPIYKLKSLTLSGGASFEGVIIRNSLFQDIGTKKIVPCLKKGSFGESLPSPIAGRSGIDFTNPVEFETKYKELCEALLNRPAHQRPTLGPNPLYENKPIKNDEELKYTDFRRDNDVKWITTLFSNISIYAIERYLDRSPENVEDIFFESHDKWNQILNSIAFRIYQVELKELILDFYSTWDEIVKLGLNYYGPSNHPNFYKFYGYAADVFKTQDHEKTFFAICEKMSEMKDKLSKLVNYIMDNFEIDIESLSRKYEESMR